MPKDVRSYVLACDVCARSKTPRTHPAGELQPLPIPCKPWSHISMDFISDLPLSEGKSVVWVVVDRFSKMVHFVPLSKLPNAKTLASLFIEHVVRLHGVPENIVSDRGVQFVSSFWRAFCRRCDISLSFSSAFHPQTNGQTERLNQAVELFLRCYVSHNQLLWVRYLPLAEFAINNRVNSSTGVSPFFCNSGLHPRFSSNPSVSSLNPQADSFTSRLCTVWAQVQSNLEKAQETQCKHANKRRSKGVNFVLGDKVWLSTKNLALKQCSKKFSPRFIGPYNIIEIINPVSFRLKLPDSLRIHDVFHKSLLKKYVSPVVPVKGPPPPVEVEGQEEFIISKIIDVRKIRNSFQYLVHWKGFGPEERSWIPMSRMHASRLITKFHRENPGKPCPQGLGPVAPRKRGGTVTGCRGHRVHTRSPIGHRPAA